MILYEPALLRSMADMIFGAVAYLPPATWTARLYTTSPFGAAGVEITGSGYAAQAIANTTLEWQATDGVASNINAINFGTAGGGGWASVGAVVLCDGTTPLVAAALPMPMTVLNGQSAIIPPAMLALRPGGVGAGAMSPELAQALALHLYGRTLWTPPIDWTVGLMRAGGSTEIYAAGYGARTVANTLTKFPAATFGGVKSMATALRWPASGGAASNWGQIDQVGFFADGSLSFVAPMNSVTVPAGGSYTFASGPIFSWETV